MNQFFESGGQSIGVSASTSVLPMNIQERDSQESSPTPQFKSINSSMLSFTSVSHTLNFKHEKLTIIFFHSTFISPQDKKLTCGLGTFALGNVGITKGDQSWVFIGRTDAETEIPILWPPHAKS